MSTSMRSSAEPGGSCDPCPARQRGFCQRLSDHGIQAARLLASATRRVKAGRDLLKQGETADSVYLLRDGWTALYTVLPDGRRQVLRFSLPGDMLALGCRLERSPYAVQALTDVTVCVVPRRRLLDLGRIHPTLALELLSLACDDCSAAYDHLISVGRRTARERVAILLLEIFCRARKAIATARGEAIALPLTQAHIGDALGLTSVHTNRMLARLRDDGIIALSKRTLLVLDADRLAAVALGEAMVPPVSALR